VKIEIQGGERLVAQFHNAPQIVSDEATRAVQGELKNVVTALTIYPAERPNQRYQRTYELERGWRSAQPKWRITLREFFVQLTNRVPYVKWVQGEQQAWFHRGRWTKASVIMLEHRDSIANALRRAADKAAQRIARGG
jgi:hypothetical protein